MRALISVSDKTGVVELAHELSKLNFEIISTGGTAKALRQAEISCTEVSDLTKFPEILGGRVKTLHPKIFGGILYCRENRQHQTDVENQDIPSIDWVVVNLYPFEKIHLEDKISKAEMIEFIDIGGVSLLRAAAKNFTDVVVLCDQNDYLKVAQELKEKQTVSPGTKKMLAAKAFAHTAHYDSMIAKYFKDDLVSGSSLPKNMPASAPANHSEQYPLFPNELTIGLRKVSDLRYGENPQQKASLYKESGKREWGIVHAEKLQGKELSFNNYLDLNSAWEIVNSFNLSQGSGHINSNQGKFIGVCCVIIKHTNPCGVAIGENSLESFQTAYNADSLSAFGGVIGFSSTVDKLTAEEISKSFFECIIAPDFTSDALEIFKKKQNLRLLRQNTTLSLPYEFDIKRISGGFLLQEKDYEDNAGDSSNNVPLKEGVRIVTKRAPTPEEIYSLDFAWKVCKFVKSNAIVLVKGTTTQGIGAGQMSRIDSLKMAIQKAGLQIHNPVHQLIDKRQSPPSNIQSPLSRASGLPLVMASDAFFPFRDCVDESAKAGISAIIQPGGSLRDQESIDAANEHSVAMIFTGVRHFKH